MKPVEEIKKDLREKVGLGLDLAIQALKNAMPPDVPKYNEVILIEGRYRELHKNWTGSLMSDDEAQIEFNKLREQVLAFINDLKAEDFVKELAEKAEQEAKTGKVLYRIPDHMQLQKEVKCIIRVAFDEKILMRDLAKEADDMIKDVRIAETMAAEIIDPNEQPAFAIRTFSEKIQLIDQSDFTEWLFYVKPLLEGTFPLLLKISIVEILDGKERKREIVLEEVVQVVATAPESTGEEKFADAGYTVQLSGVDGGAAATTGGGSAKKKISTSAAAAILTGVVLAFIAVWNFAPQFIKPIDPDVTLGPSRPGAGEWEKIKNSNDSTELIKFQEMFPESDFADSAQHRLNSLSLSLSFLQKGDSLIFSVQNGILPIQLTLRKNGEAIANQSFTDIKEAIFSKREYGIQPGEHEVLLTDALGTRKTFMVTVSDKEVVKETIAEVQTKPASSKPKPKPKPKRSANPNTQGGAGTTTITPATPDDKPADTQPPAETVYEFKNMARAPIYKGCRSNKQARLRSCTESNIRSYVEQSLKRLPEYRNGSLTGRMSIVFIIEKNGQVTVESVRSSFDEALKGKVEKIVEDMPQFQPGLNALGEPVQVRYELPIRFE